MKRTLLSMKEIFQELGMTVQSIRGAYWRGDIPASRIGNMLRFDQDRAQRSFLAKGWLPTIVRARRAIAGQGRRRAPHIAPV